MRPSVSFTLPFSDLPIILVIDWRKRERVCVCTCETSEQEEEEAKESEGENEKNEMSASVSLVLEMDEGALFCASLHEHRTGTETRREKSLSRIKARQRGIREHTHTKMVHHRKVQVSLTDTRGLVWLHVILCFSLRHLQMQLSLCVYVLCAYVT